MGKWSLLFLSYYTSFTWILILDLLHDNFTITPVEISSKQGDKSCVNLFKSKYATTKKASKSLGLESDGPRFTYMSNCL